MICIIAPSHSKARAWADNQGLESSEWFFVDSPKDLYIRQDFHTIVVGEFPPYQLSLFEQIYHLAKQRGALGRKIR